MTVGEKSVNPLPDGTSSTKREQKKKTRFAGLFFLTGLRPVLPLDQSVSTQQTVYVVAPTLQLLTISLAKPFL